MECLQCKDYLKIREQVIPDANPMADLYGFFRDDQRALAEWIAREDASLIVWLTEETLATNKRNAEAMQDDKTWEIEFESDIPAHQTMENH